MIDKNYFRALLAKMYVNTFRKEYKEILEIKDNEDLILFQERKLCLLLKHCDTHVPYYHRVFREVGLVVNGRVDLSKFHLVPILTKEIIRAHCNELISDDFSKRKWFYNASGGSTGEPVRFLQDKNYVKWSRATNTYYHNTFLKIKRIQSREVRLWGNTRDLFKGTFGLKSKLENFLTNTTLLNSYRINESDVAHYIEIINKVKPQYIRGYTGSLYQLCEYANKHHIPMHSPTILATAAENLTEGVKKSLERTFHTKVFDFYGAREAENIAGECKNGSMHVFTFLTLVELLDKDNKNVSEDKEGRVIVTPLHNFSMPLVRYELGDMAIQGNDNCVCGSYLPTLKKITGRITEHFLKEDGSIVPFEFFIHLFVVYLESGIIKQFQLIQEDFKRIIVKVVTKNAFDKSVQKDIEDKIRIEMGQDCAIEWEFVKEIPKAQSGKYAYIKSLVWQKNLSVK